MPKNTCIAAIALLLLNAVGSLGFFLFSLPEQSEWGAMITGVFCSIVAALLIINYRRIINDRSDPDLLVSDGLSRKELRDLQRNEALLAALHQETDTQRADVASRTGTMHTRASILIAAASLSTALQVGQQGPWFIGAVWLSVTSALLGALVLLPRMGDQLNIKKNEDDLWGVESVAFSRDLMHQKLDLIREDETALRWRRRVLLGGYTALALSLAAAAMHLSTNIDSEPEPNVPETIVTSTPTA